MLDISDEQLIERLAAGDSSSLGTLFERHHRALFNYVRQLTGDDMTAEDLVQETFLRMLHGARRFQPGSCKRWMLTIARNLFYDRVRHRRFVESLPVQNTQPPSESDGPEDDYQRTQHAERLRIALQALPPATREVIWLGRFHVDGFAELGQILECSPGAAKVRLHRARTQAALDRLGAMGTATSSQLCV